MSQLVNRKVVLKSHPQGALKESDFEIVNDEVGEVTAGSVLVRVDVLSIDAFIRTTLDGGGFHTSAQLGGVVPALGVGTVVESADPGFAVGDTVTGPFCSQSYALIALCDVAQT
jgi:NADPH-dependent curcumin reductase